MRKAGLGILLAALVGWLFVSRVHAMQLALVGEDPERVLACLPVSAGVPFHLEFVNSIYLAPVRESFTCDSERGISLVGVESPSYGVFEYYGLVRDPSGKSKVSRPVGELRLRSHDYENHVLVVDGRRVHLKEFVGGGKSLVIRVSDDARCQPERIGGSR